MVTRDEARRAEASGSYDASERFYVLDLTRHELYAERCVSADEAASAAYGIACSQGSVTVVYDYTESREFAVGEQVAITPELMVTVFPWPWEE